MEALACSCVLLVVATMLMCAWRVVHWVWLKPKKMEKCLRDQGLKGNPYKFLFGDLKEMEQLFFKALSKPISLTDDIIPRVLPFVHKSIATHGKVFFTWTGTNPMVHVSEPAMVQEVLGNYQRFQKAPIGGNGLIKLIASGLIEVDGDQWVKHRRIINPAFHVEKLKRMVPAFYVSCSEMIKKLEETVMEKTSCEVDVWPHIQKLTSDVISRTAFGSSFEEGRMIFQLIQELVVLIMRANQSFYIPGMRFLPTSLNMRIKEIDGQIRASIRSIIDKRVMMMKSLEIDNDDLLGILLDSNYKVIKQHGDNNFGLSTEEVIKECKLFYAAGQDTSANLLAWTMILLSQYVNWQTRARNEILDVIGERMPDFEGLGRLKIVHMILNEVLRLYPAAPALPRMIHEETKLGNMTLPAGTYIQLNSLLLHHDHDLWGDDAKEFNPERFSQGVSKAIKGQASYFPFGGGPRVCIGQNFAMLEAKMALVMILRRFCFELSPSYSHAPHHLITLKPQFGTPLILRKL